jgi:hypothetical protein
MNAGEMCATSLPVASVSARRGMKQEGINLLAEQSAQKPSSATAILGCNLLTTA